METTDDMLTESPSRNGKKIFREITDYYGAGKIAVDVLDGKYDSVLGEDISDAMKSAIEDYCDTLPRDAEDEAKDIEELYEELRDTPRYSTGHLSNSIRIDTHGYEDNPLIWSVVFDEDFFMSNPTYHLGSLSKHSELGKIGVDSAGNVTRSKRGRPMIIRAGGYWEPRADEYDYRKNRDILVSGGREFDEEYVREKMKKALGRE